MDELLVKYMLGEASAEEATAVEQWLQASNDNRRYFEHFKVIWHTGEQLRRESRLDPDASWTAFKQNVETGSTLTAHKVDNPFKRWYKIAAVGLVLMCASAALFNILKPGSPEMLVFETRDSVKTATLPDGSTITLNKNSIIKYPEQFVGTNRKVSLTKGEGFFNVQPDKTKPFVIRVKDVTVRVVGTSFNIKLQKTKTEVIVETGVVQVIGKKVKVKLRPKEKADVDARSGEIKKGQTADALYNYYRTNQLVANATPLWRVAEVLSEIYKVQISIPDKRLAARKLTTIMQLDSLDKNLDVIAVTFNLKISRTQNKIIIY